MICSKCGQEASWIETPSMTCLHCKASMLFCENAKLRKQVEQLAELVEEAFCEDAGHEYPHMEWPSSEIKQRLYAIMESEGE